MPNELLTKLFRAVPESLALFRVSDERYEDVSNRLLEVTGYTRDEVIGRTAQELGFWVDRADSERLHRALEHDRHIYRVPVRYRTKQGEVRWALASVESIDIDDERFALTLIADVTEDRRREQAAAESARRFRALIDHLPIGILLLGPNAEILVCNPAALHLLGASEDQLLGRTPYDTTSNVIREDGSALPASEHPVSQAIARARSVLGIVLGIWRPNRADRAWLELDAIPLVSNDGSVTEVICCFRDVTGRKLRQEALERRLALAERLPDDDPLPEVPGWSAAMLAFKQRAMEAASSRKLPVLLRGERGTGKGLIARAIHNRSSRANGPFITVNCAAIPAELLESELFGHERGAFTGAVATKKGLFEEADSGTLLLDEVGDLPLLMQAKLLTVLQERRVRRVGGSTEIPIDVRVVASTNRDIERAMAEERFRQDLYDRLKGFVLRIPSLRERGPDDLELLVDHFVSQAAREEGKDVEGVEPEVLDIFRRYSWPGNVRELELVVGHMVARTSGALLTANLVPRDIVEAETPSVNGVTRAGSGAQPGRGVDADTAPAAPRQDFRRDHAPSRTRILRALRQERWNKVNAAHRLHITRDQLYRLMKARGVPLEPPSNLRKRQR
jgi:PAS domain S-box-containing protein